MTIQISSQFAAGVSNSAADLSHSPESLASYGGGQVAYIKPIRCEEAASLYPRMPYLSPWFTLYSLHAADGKLLAVTDSLEEAVAGATSRELQAVSLN